MKNLSLNTKLFMIILTEVIISTIILTSQSVKTIQKMSHQNVIQYEAQVIDAKKEALKNYADMAKGILQIYRDKVTKDTTPQELEDIKKDAIKAMDSMVYGDDNGYVFVWSYDGVPLAFNPRPDLIGKKLLHLKGGEGRMVIEDH
ncbi:MAG: cache domain-containing protein, partial [Campylobacterota bacterium]|nr:cache domain-containing protein [Campylobacterota bacterium]